MRAVVQRVDGASVVVGRRDGRGDRAARDCASWSGSPTRTPRRRRPNSPANSGRSACWHDEKSCSDIDAPLLVISQFTLYGDARKGRRPTWNAAAPGDVAEPLVDEVVAQLRALGATVATGRFGAQMRVSLTNDGPFTVLLEI